MIQFRKGKGIRPCYLTKGKLEALVNLLKTDFSPSDRLDTFTLRTFSDEIDISEHTLEDFLNHERLPPVLTRLIINIIEQSDQGDINKRLDLTFFDNYINLNISGSSESWVNGKFIQIDEFLKKTRPVFWFLYTPNILVAPIIQGAIFPLLIAGLVMLGKRIFERGFDFAEIWLLLGIFFLSVLALIIGKYKYTKIFLTEKLSFSDKYKDIITLVIIFLTIVTTVFAVMGYFKKP